LDFNKFLNQLRSFVRGLTPLQQIFLGISAVVVAGALWLFVTLINKDDYKTLYTGLSASDAQAVIRRLDGQGVRYKLSQDGASLSVPAEQIDSLRLDLASKGMPQSGRLGFELFDKPNWAGSDFSEKVNYQRALEGELERTIQTIEDVESVRVHLVMPRESLFTDREREAKAAVVVKLRSGRLASNAVIAITHLVASAVDLLPPENVTIVNADGNTPLSQAPRSEGAASGSGDMAKSLENKLIATLSPVIGTQGVRATVMVEYNLSSSEKTQELYDPATATVLSSQESEQQQGSSLTAGIPGAASNVPAARPPESPAPAVSRGGDSQVSRNASKTYAVSKTVQHVLDPPGAIKRIATAILVDDAHEISNENGQKVEKRHKRTAEEMRQIQDLAKAAMGFNEARGDNLVVENISFETLPPEVLPTPNKMEQALRLAERWRGPLRYVILLLLFAVVYMVVLRPIKKQALATFREAASRLAASQKETPKLASGVPEAKAAGAAIEAGKEPLAGLESKAAEDNQIVMLKQHLVDRVKREPASASRLIQNWMRRDEGAN
jgi:flagellar M-ring protein FliF